MTGVLFLLSTCGFQPVAFSPPADRRRVLGRSR